MIIKIRPISLSRAARPLHPKIVLRYEEKKRTKNDPIHAIKMAPIMVRIFDCFAWTITAAKTAGPATNGIARGTINGSCSLEGEVLSSEVGKIIFKQIRNKITPPEISMAQSVI